MDGFRVQNVFLKTFIFQMSAGGIWRWYHTYCLYIHVCCTNWAYDKCRHKWMFLWRFWFVPLTKWLEICWKFCNLSTRMLSMYFIFKYSSICVYVVHVWPVHERILSCLNFAVTICVRENARQILWLLTHENPHFKR